MDKDRFYIEMPDEMEVRAEIDFIVTKGLKPRELFIERLIDIYKQVGFKHLFHDGVELIFIIFIALPIFIFSIMSFGGYETVNDGGIYVFLFTFSPIIYLSMSLLAFLNAKQNNTYELEMTCKYDMYQLAAFRMFVFSIISILLNLIFICVIVTIHHEIDFFRAFMISITSLFLFSAIFLAMIAKLSSRKTKYITITGWILLNVALRMFGEKVYNELLRDISLYVYLSVTIVCIYAYLKNLRRFMNLRSVQGGI